MGGWVRRLLLWPKQGWPKHNSQVVGGHAVLIGVCYHPVGRDQEKGLQGSSFTTLDKSNPSKGRAGSFGTLHVVAEGNQAESHKGREDATKRETFRIRLGCHNPGDACLFPASKAALESSLLTDWATLIQMAILSQSSLPRPSSAK